MTKTRNELRDGVFHYDDTAPAELVTEEIVMAAAQAFTHRVAWSHDTVESIDAALRAVAPMIAARMSYDDKLRMCDRAVAAERERCAHTAAIMGANSVAAAIRARGETP